LSTVAGVLWSDILKNPSESESSLLVNLDFPHPVPMTGCVGLYYGRGPLISGKATMSADLDLRYRPLKNANPNTVVDVGGEYCFGQDGGCQNATEIDGEAFAVPNPDADIRALGGSVWKHQRQCVRRKPGQRADSNGQSVGRRE
jgi:hypothetical protein